MTRRFYDFELVLLYFTFIRQFVFQLSVLFCSFINQFFFCPFIMFVDIKQISVSRKRDLLCDPNRFVQMLIVCLNAANVSSSQNIYCVFHNSNERKRNSSNVII